jgi:hypothetical protein
METLRLIRPANGWRSRADAVWEAHFRSLDQFYFTQGTETLRAVQRWAAGRAEGPPAEERFPNRFPSSPGADAASSDEK